MSTGLDRGGRRGREFFLSAHRCPEVDLLPRHDSKFTCTSQSVANYLEVSSTCRSKEEEEEEGSISDWSEEDLSLHFSPSVILPSDEEESDPENNFECIDITMETQVKGPKGEALKMVPKRLIQLKKKKDTENITNQEKAEQLRVIRQNGPAEGGGANCEVSATELPTANHYPDLLLRQHSVPASFPTCPTTSGDVDSYRVYRGLVVGASQGFHTGDARGNSAPRQRLQKSFSLDETKTKMASCIIKSVLSKKMQVEQNNCNTSYLQKKPALLPVFPQPADQRMREGGGGEVKAPVHIVRDMRSLVKNTCSFSFSTVSTTPDKYSKPTRFKVIGQEDSPPPTYQQAVGIKGHDETKMCPASVYSSRGHVAKVAVSLSQSQDRQQTDRFILPITWQRRGSEPVISRRKVDDVTWPVECLDPPTNPPVSTDLSEISQSDRGRDVSLAGTSPAPSFLSQAPFHPPSSLRPPQGTQPLLSAQVESPILAAPSQSAPSSSQQILQSYFCSPATLPAIPPTLHRHPGKVGYVHSPLRYIETQPQPPQPVPTVHLLRRSEENGSTGNTSNHLDHFIRTYPPHQTKTAGHQENHGRTATQEQHDQHQQQQFLDSIQGFSPAQVDSDFIVDITGATAVPRPILSGPAPNGPAPCHMMLQLNSGQYFYVNTFPPPHRKMLLDPETGQYIQVFLPAARSAPNTVMFPVRCVNPTPIAINSAPTTINTTPSVLSVVQFQPTVDVFSLHTTPCHPFTLHTPSANVTHTTAKM